MIAPPVFIPKIQSLYFKSAMFDMSNPNSIIGNMKRNDTKTIITASSFEKPRYVKALVNSKYAR